MTYSLQRLLIILGLVVIPFYEILIRALPFVGSHAPDSRVPKEILALVFALSIGLLAVWQGTLKPFRNKWFLFIPTYLLISFIMSPYAPLNINNVEVGDFYFWKPFAEVLCFTFMIIAVASGEWDVEHIIKIMVICGSVMAGYVILQWLGLDQFWNIKGFNFMGAGGAFTSVRAQALGGNLGQPTVVASWIVMMIPLAIYLKKWWSVVLMAIACLLTQGAMVIGALLLIGAALAIRHDKFFIISIVAILIVGFTLAFLNKSYVLSRMDGRSEVWKEVVSDIKNGQLQGEIHRFPLTGTGFGRFPLSFPMKHHSTFQQAHNDPMQFAYDCGLIGEYLLLAAIFVMLISTLFHTSFLIFSIAVSFLAIFFCSLGSFPFQLGAHQFYAAVLVGFLNNDKLIRGA